MPENPKSRSPRIEIRPDLWPALQVEAIARGVSPKELVNSLILAALSPRAYEFMSPSKDPIPCTHDPMIPSSHDTTTPETIATKTPITPADQGGAAIKSGEPQKGRRLSGDPDALARLKEMYRAGVRSPTVIGKAINYPRTTVSEMLSRLRERGEI